jgi:DNA-binding CsgD family transcriptional regulator
VTSPRSSTIHSGYSMSNSLQHIFQSIDRASDESELRSSVAANIGTYFAAKRSAIFFFDLLYATRKGRLHLLDSRFPKAIADAFSIEKNPVVRYIVERHSPVRENLVTTPRIWQTICPREDHWHVMAGPIIADGKIVGAVGCTREKSMPAFDDFHIADLSGICLHLSAKTAVMRKPNILGGSELLTPRELQIAELVALGKTNAEIGRELWIAENSVKQALKRMFRKLEVSSRAEMVANLARITTRSNLYCLDRNLRD